MASFSVLVDSITETEKNAFSSGIDTQIKIIQDNDELVSFQDNLTFDQSFTTINLTTEKEPVAGPADDIKEDTPYLITIDGLEGLLRRDGGLAVYEGNYNYDGVHTVIPQSLNEEVENRRKFYFYKVGENQFKIRYGEAILDEPRPEDFDGGWWMYRVENTNDRTYYITSDSFDKAETFEIIRDEEGWYTFRVLNLPAPGHLGPWNPIIGFNKQRNRLILTYEEDEEYYDLKFKLLSEVNWEIQELGVEYLPPIYGPTRVDFAFRSILSNCSSATLTEEVGRVLTKSRTTAFSITEGISLFASAAYSAEVSIEVGGTTTIGGDIYGASQEIDYTVGVKVGVEYTASTTLNREREITEEESVSEEVSRIRTVELPPFTVVDVYDAIKSVNDIYIPFVLKYRLTGTYALDGKELSGNEIAQNLSNNNFSGLINSVNDTDVLFSLRGSAKMNTLFQSSSGALEIVNGCTNN